MLCIYCNEREADAREHYLPQCLGRFQNFEPLLDRLCQKCNADIGALEREFCRRSPEAIVRGVNYWRRNPRAALGDRGRYVAFPKTPCVRRHTATGRGASGGRNRYRY